MDKKSFIFLTLLSIAFLFLNNYLFPPREVPPSVQEISQPKVEEVNKASNEELYVIENSYQQLVFSSAGGGLAEINLVLKDKDHPASYVRPIAFDRVLAEDYPQQAHFPLHDYQTFAGNKKASSIGGYYPLLRRNLDPKYYALAISADAQIGSSRFSVTKLEKNLIEFVGTIGQCHITKTITLPDDATLAPYCFDVKINITGPCNNLSISTGIPEVELISGSPSPTLKYRFDRNHKPIVEQLDLPKNFETIASIRPDWVCNSNGFLGVVIDPITDHASGFTTHYVSGEDAPTRIAVIDAQNDLYPLSKYPGYFITLPLQNNIKEFSFRVYAGPFAKDVLSLVDKHYTDSATQANPGFISCISFHGWFSFISEPFAKFLFFLMEIFHFISRSWGISIILLTIALRIMLYPLNAWTIKSTVKMQQISPKVAALQEKYKKDPKRAQMEIMNLYRQQGVNPLGGCLPLLIQMPFLIGMFDLLKSSFDLRGASFIPGWIDNLTAPDVVFSWAYPIWFFGTSLHLLPIVLGVVMYLQQKMSSNAPKDKSQLTDQQRQQKFMGNLMVIIFSILFYHFPSGLNIYWLSSMLLGILQQWWMTKNKQSLVTNM